MNMADIKIAVTDNDIASCWEVMFVLRPMLNKEEFTSQIKFQQKEGYTLLYITENGKTVSVAGYRIFTMLYCGKMLYIDDLSTLESSRGKGHATVLLNHMCQIAEQENCRSVQLDSGPARTTAHKLYFREGFTINAFHFNKTL
jgi:GNAT superfamily N-acetyltransferase